MGGIDRMDMDPEKGRGGGAFAHVRLRHLAGDNTTHRDTHWNFATSKFNFCTHTRAQFCFEFATYVHTIVSAKTICAAVAKLFAPFET